MNGIVFLPDEKKEGKVLNMWNITIANRDCGNKLKLNATTFWHVDVALTYRKFYILILYRVMKLNVIPLLLLRDEVLLS